MDLAITSTSCAFSIEEHPTKATFTDWREGGREERKGRGREGRVGDVKSEREMDGTNKGRALCEYSFMYRIACTVS